MLEMFRHHWPIIWAAATLIANVVLVLLAKTYAKREDVEVLKARVNSMENILSTLPDQKDLHNLQLEIANLRGDLKAALPELKQLRNLSDLLLQNELKDKK